MVPTSLRKRERTDARRSDGPMLNVSLPFSRLLGRLSYVLASRWVTQGTRLRSFRLNGATVQPIFAQVHTHPMGRQ